MQKLLKPISGATQPTEPNYLFAKVVEIIDEVKAEHKETKVVVTHMSEFQVDSWEIRFESCGHSLFVVTNMKGRLGLSFCMTSIRDNVKFTKAFPSQLGYTEENTGRILHAEPHLFREHLYEVFSFFDALTKELTNIVKSIQ